MLDLAFLNWILEKMILSPPFFTFLIRVFFFVESEVESKIGEVQNAKKYDENCERMCIMGRGEMKVID